MNIDKIEKLLAVIAKGDKTTLNAVIDLLQEVSSYSPKNGRASQKPISEDVQPKKELTASQRASLLMEGDYSSFQMPVTPKFSQTAQHLLNDDTNKFLSNSSPNANSIFGLEKPTAQRAPDYGGLSNDVGIQSYAGNLL